ncbi:hypothetical protein GCM10027053_26080 [Intrasporangium mesophilum]
MTAWERVRSSGEFAFGVRIEQHELVERITPIDVSPNMHQVAHRAEKGQQPRQPAFSSQRDGLRWTSSRGPC